MSPSYMLFMSRLNEVAVKTFCFGLTEMSAITPFDRMALIQKNHKLIITLQVGYLQKFGKKVIMYYL